MLSRKAIMTSAVLSLSLFVLAAFDGEGTKEPDWQEAFENDFLVGIVVDEV